MFLKDLEYAPTNHMTSWDLFKSPLLVFYAAVSEKTTYYDKFQNTSLTSEIFLFYVLLFVEVKSTSYRIHLLLIKQVHLF